MHPSQMWQHIRPIVKLTGSARGGERFCEITETLNGRTAFLKV
jgi:hypothetical protein